MILVNNRPAFGDVDQSDQEGVVAYFEDGNLLYAEATGPFNKALILAATEAQMPLFSAMTERGRWAQVLTFTNSLIAGPEVASFFVYQLQLTSGHGIAPEVTAVVIPDGLEGACILKPRIADAYTQAGRNFQIFSSTAQAVAWAKGVLAVTR